MFTIRILRLDDSPDCHGPSRLCLVNVDSIRILPAFCNLRIGGIVSVPDCDMLLLVRMGVCVSTVLFLAVLLLALFGIGFFVPFLAASGHVM